MGTNVGSPKNESKKPACDLFFNKCVSGFILAAATKLKEEAERKD